MPELFQDSLHSSMIPTKVASEISGYNADYLARLCREKKIVGTQVGRTWFINRTSLEAFVAEQEARKRDRAEELRTARGREYRKAQKPVLYAALGSFLAKKAEHKAPSAVKKAPVYAHAVNSPIPSKSIPSPLGYSRPLAACAVALAVVAGTAYASSSLETLHVAAHIENAVLTLARNSGPRLIASSALRVTDSSDTGTSADRVRTVAVAFTTPDADDVTRAFAARAGTQTLASVAAVREITDESRAPFATTHAAGVAQSRIANATAALQNPLATVTYAYLATGAHAYRFVADAQESYTNLITHIGDTALATAAVARDAVVATPRGVDSILDGYANGIYAWTNAAPKVAGTAVMVLYDAGETVNTIAAATPSSVREAKDTFAYSMVDSSHAISNGVMNTEASALAPVLAHADVLARPATLAYVSVSNVYARAVHAGSIIASLPIRAEDTFLGMAGYTASLMDGPDHEESLAQADGTTSVLPASAASFLPQAWQRIFAVSFGHARVFAQALFTSGFHTLATLAPGGTVIAPALTIVDATPAETLALPVPAGTLTYERGTSNTTTYNAGGTQIVNNYFPQVIFGGSIDNAVLAIVRPFVQQSIDSSLRGRSRNSGGGSDNNSGGSVQSDGAALSNVTITGGTAIFSSTTAGELTAGSTTINGSLTVTGAISGGSLTVSNLSSNNTIIAPTFTATSTTGTSTFPNISATNAELTNATIGAATTTSLYALAAHIVSGIFDSFTATLATITNLSGTNSQFVYSTSTNATSTNLFALNGVITNSTSTNLFATNGVITNATTTSLTTSNLGIGGSTFTTLLGTGLVNNGGALSVSTSSLGLDTSYFKQGGNTFGAAATIGTKDAFALNFITNNAAVGTFDAAGNFGIGTTTPSTKLSVGGNALISGSLTAGSITTGSLNVPGAANVGSLSIGSLSGFLKATAGAISTSLIDLSTDVTSTLSQTNGGTGFSSYASGDLLYADSGGTLTRLPVGAPGQVLKVQAGLPAWGVDQTIGGGGSDGIFATSTGKIYPLDTSNVLVLGSNATSTQNSIFEVNGQQYISTKLSIGSTSPAAGTALAVTGNALISGNLTASTLRIGALNGPLQANNGVVSATSSIGVLYGGTGLTIAPTYGQLLVGNSAGGYALTATSTLGLSTTDIAEGTNLYFSNARADARINATSTIGTLTSAPNLGTLSTTLTGILKATSGVLSNAILGTDYLAPNSLSGVYPIQYDSGTGAISLAFGTTTANTWGPLQTFNDIAINGALYDGAASPGAPGQLLLSTGTGVAWTGTTTLGFTSGTVTSVNASGGTTGLAFTGGPITTAGTLTLSGTLGIANGGTNAGSQTTNGIAYYDGTRITTNGAFTYTGTNVALTGGTFTAPQYLAQDSAGAPGFSWSTDTTTGVYHAATNQIGFATGGIGRVYIDGNGYLGIGTTSASQALSVNGNALISGNLNTASLTLGGSTFTSLLGSGLVNNGGVLSVSTSSLALDTTYFKQNGNSFGALATLGTTDSNALRFITNGVEALRVTTAGRVGIGTTTPDTTLTIASANSNGINLAADTGNPGASGRLFFSTATAGQSVTLVNGGGSLGFYTGGTPSVTGGTQRLTLSSGGFFGIGSSTPTSLLSIDALAGGISSTTSLLTIKGESSGNRAAPYIQVLNSGGTALFTLDQFGNFSGTSGFLMNGGGFVGSTPYKFLGQPSTGTINIFGAEVPSNQSANLFLARYSATQVGLAGITGIGNIVAGTTTTPYRLAAQGVFGSTQDLFDVASSTALNGTATTSLFRITGGGNVGVGTTTPQAKLDIAGGRLAFDNNQGISFRTSTGALAAALTLSVADNLQIYSPTQGGNIQYIGGYVFADHVFYSSSTVELLRIKSNGNVGIGTTTPYAKLSVAGDFALTGGLYDRNATRGTNGQLLQTTGTGVQWVSTSTLGFGTGNANATGTAGQVAYFNGANSLIGSAGFTFDGTNLAVPGSITAGGQHIGIGGSGSASTPAYSFLSDLSTGIFHPANNTIGFTTGGVERARIDGNGYLGIGTTSPGYALDVISSGTAFQATQNGGSGTAVFQFARVNHASQNNVWGYNITTGTGLSNGSLLVSPQNGVTADIGFSGLNGGYASPQLAIKGATGYVGIGTTSPITNFHVSANGTSQFIGDTSNNAAFTSYNQRAFFGYSLANGNAVVQGGAGKGIEFDVNSGTPGSGQAAVITSAGNFGIGNTAPAYKLDVAGFINTDQYSGYKQNGNTILYSSTTQQSTFVGHNAGVGQIAFATSTNLGNTGVGYAALLTATSSVNNTAVGVNALRSVSSGPFSYSGSANTGIGVGAGYTLSTGYENTLTGYSSGFNLTTGSANAFYGYSAGLNTNTGSQNIAMGTLSTGTGALRYNQTGNNNVAIGAGAGAGTALYSASNNILIGTNAGLSVTTNGNSNVILGYGAGYGILTGVGNIISGFQAGDNITTGSGNIILGYNTSAPSATLSGQLNIGNLIYGTGAYNSAATSSTPTSGNIGIGTTTPYAKLSVAGDFALTGGLYDRNATRGTNGQLLQTTGTGVQWVSTSTLGFSAATGTAGQVAYFNGTNSLTGTAGFTFDGANFAVPGSITSGGQHIGIGGSGTSGTPSYTFASDLSTGIFHPANNNIAFTTGGVERARIDGNGYLGIGTTSASQALSVNGNALISGNLILGNSSFSSLLGTGLSNVSGVLTVSTSSLALDTTYFKQGGNAFGQNALIGTNDAFPLQIESNGVERIRVATNGNIGIATTSPYLPLSVTGAAIITGQTVIGAPLANFSFGQLGVNGNIVFGTDANGFLATNGSGGYNELRSVNGTANFLFARTGGNVGVGTTTPTARLSVWGTNALATTGAFDVINSASTTLFRINNNGNVGIGSTSPSQLLSVAGNIYGTGTLGLGTANTTRGRLEIIQTSDTINGGLAVVNSGISGSVRFWTNAAGAGIVDNGTASGVLLLNTTNGGNVGIGTTSPYAKLSVAGDFALTGGLYDNNATRGTSGQVLQTTGTGVQWVSTSTLGFATGNANAVGTAGQVAYFNGTNSLTSTSGFTFDGTNFAVPGTITAGSQFIGIGGSGISGTPSYSFASDLSTGIFHPANNNIAFSTGGVERARIDGNGFLGIGTTSASQALSVNGSALISGNLILGNSSFSSLLGTGLVNNGGVLTVSTSSLALDTTYFKQNGNSFGALATLGTTDNNALRFITNSAEAIRILPNGNVGIGTTSPLYQFVVHNKQGTTGGTPTDLIALTASNFAFSANFGNGGNQILKISTANGTQTGSPIINGYGAAAFGGSYGIGILGHLGSVTPGASYPSVYIGGVKLNPGNTADGYPLEAGDIILSIGNTGYGGGSDGAKLFNFMGDGKLGIGTTSPTAKLHISGTVGSDAFTVSSSTGSSVFTVSAYDNVGVGVTSPSYPLDVARTFTGIADNKRGISSTLTYSPTATSTGIAYGTYSNVVLGTNVVRTGTFYGASNKVSQTTGSTTTIYGGENAGLNNGAGSIVGTLMGASNYIQNSNGIVTNSYGASNTSINFAGTVTNAYGAASGVSNILGTVTNAYGDYIDISNTSGTITNAYGLYVNTVAGTNPYALYSAPNVKSYFAGNVGIGTTSPYAKLSVTGDFALTGGLYDRNATRGTAGQILQTTGTGVQWVATSTLGLGGAGGGSVTSVDASGGTTGLSFSGGPITSSGTLTLAGVLGIANGGTGTSTAPTYGQLLVGNGAGGYNLVATSTLGITGSGTVNAGTTGQLPYYASNGTALTATSSIFLAASGNVGIGVTSPGSKLDVSGPINLNGALRMYGQFAAYASSTNAATIFGIGAGGTGSTTALAITAVGYQALTSNTNGGFNVAVGTSALYSNTNGNNNVAVGFGALLSNDNGYSNTGIGDSALNSNTSGYTNTALGASSLFSNILGNRNVAVGYGTLANATGSSTIALGYQAGDNITTGQNNLIIGTDIDAPSATASGQLNIGNIIFGTNVDSTGTTVDANANIGIGTSSPYAKLSISGDLALTGGLYDRNASRGTNGMVLQSTGTGVQWVATSTLGLGGSGGGTVNSVDASGGTTGLTFSGGPITNTGTLTLGGVLGIANGGTGTSTAPTYGQLLVGNGLGGYNLVATSSLGISGGGGSGTVNAGTTGQIPYYAANGTTLTATSSLFIASNGNIGIGTTSPYAQLSLGGGNLVLGAATAGGTPGDLFLPKLGAAAGSFLAVDAFGKVIATTTPAGGGSNFFTNSGASTYLSTGTNLGVGTTTPFGRFAIAGAANATTNLFTISTSTASATTTAFAVDSFGNINVGTGTEFTLPSSGIYRFGTTRGQTNPQLFFAGSGATNSVGINTNTPSFGAYTNLDISTGVNAAAPEPSLTLSSPYFGNKIGQTIGRTDVIGAFMTTSSNLNNTGGATLVGIAADSYSGISGLTLAGYISTNGAISNGYATIAISGAKWTGASAATSLGNSDGLLSIQNFGTTKSIFRGDGGLTIGTTTPTGAKLDVWSTAATTTDVFAVSSSTNARYLTVRYNGNVGVGTTSPAAQLTTTGTVQFAGFGAGTLQTDASGNVTVSSDERLKSINGGFSRGLADIQKLSPILYHWNAASGLDRSTQYAGFSAQNVQSAIPEAIDTDPRGYLSLQDRPILAASVNAIKELAGRTDSLSLATTSLSTQLQNLSNAFATAQTDSSMPHALTATNITAESMAIAQGFMADTVNATTATVSGTVSANRYVVPQTASMFTFGSSTMSVELPDDVLAQGGSVDLYKLASYGVASTQALAARTDLLSMKIDDITTRLAALEALHSATTTDATDTAQGAVGLTVATLQGVLHQLGVAIHDGIAMLDTLVTHQLVLVKGTDGTSSTGTDVIPSGATKIVVSNPLVHPSSKIFLTFTSSINGSWYLAEKKEGSFTVMLAQAQSSDVEFDYFLLQTDPNAQVAAVGETQPPEGVPEAPSTPASVTEDGGPVVSLNGSAAVQIPQGAVWTDPGASATAADGADLTSQITVTGSVDTTTAGLYTITYSVTDAAGKNGEASRIITVLSPTMAPSDGGTVTATPPADGAEGTVGAAPADAGSGGTVSSAGDGTPTS